MRARAIISAISIASVLLIAPVAASAASLGDTATGTGISQTHTLYYNTTPCAAHGNTTMYQFSSWKTAFHRSAGADRELDTVYYKIEAYGFLCSNPWVVKSTGIASYHIQFGSLNDISRTGTLNWPYLLISADGDPTGSSTAGHYTRRAGGQWVTSLCNNVTLTSSNWCSQL
jgi:hypothetical protein